MSHLKRTMPFQKHYEDSLLINASAEDIFTYIDDPLRFSSHMTKASWMMGGGHMIVDLDEGRGQKVGSHIRLSGKAFGIPLFLDEVVTHHESPRKKVWKTVGDVKLIVIGHYQMDVKTETKGRDCLLYVSIDYDLPSANAWLGRLFGNMYAKWCVRQMIQGTSNYFSHPASSTPEK